MYRRFFPCSGLKGFFSALTKFSNVPQGHRKCWPLTACVDLISEVIAHVLVVPHFSSETAPTRRRRPRPGIDFRGFMMDRRGILGHCGVLLSARPLTCDGRRSGVRFFFHLGQKPNVREGGGRKPENRGRGKGSAGGEGEDRGGRAQRKGIKEDKQTCGHGVC